MFVKYDVIFKGLLNRDVREDVVKEKLVKNLKISARQVDHLFAKAPIVVKKSVDKEAGLKYQNAFARAGALCELSKVETAPETKFELSLEPKEDGTAEEVKQEEIIAEVVHQFYCPECKSKQLKVGLCDSCRSKIIPETKPQVKKRNTLKSRIVDNKEVIKETLLQTVIDWVKGNLWKAAIVFILIPVFGSKLVFSSVFYTQDKHLIYQTLEPVTVCVKDAGNFDIPHRQAETNVNVQFSNEFSVEEKKQNLIKWSNEACKSKFKLEMGNIGSEVIELINLEFQIWRFVVPDKGPRAFLDVRSRDITASSPR